MESAVIADSWRELQAGCGAAKRDGLLSAAYFIVRLLSRARN